MHLCNEVIATLTSMMCNNIENKAYFRQVVSYDQLYNCIIKIQDGKPARSTIQSLIDMLLDGHSSLGRQRVFRNGDVLTLILRLIPCCDILHQAHILEQLKQMLVGNLQNQSVANATEPGVLDMLLDLFQNDFCTEGVQRGLLELVEILGSHSITVRQLRRLFRLLQSRGVYRPAYSWRLLQALQNMLHYGAITGTFVFSGEQSGISIPLRSAPPRGFGFFTWIRFEQMSTQNDADSTRAGAEKQTIFYLFDEEEFGIELALVDKKLVLRCNQRHNHTQSYFISIDGRTPLMPKASVWYFIGITHKLKSFQKASQLRVYFNSQVALELNLQYPISSSNQLNCFIGAIPTRVRPLSIKVEQCFRGQLACMLFTKEALSRLEVAALCPSPSNSMSLVINPGEVLKDIDGSFIRPYLLAVYHPRCTRGSIVTDCKPLDLCLRPDTPRLDGRLFSGTQASVINSIWDALDCLGGLTVIMPLFAQFDQPVKPNDYSINPKLNEQVLRIIARAMPQTAANRKLMKRSGFLLLRYLLEQLSPQHMTIEALSAIMRIIEVAQDAVRIF